MSNAKAIFCTILREALHCIMITSLQIFPPIFQWVGRARYTTKRKQLSGWKEVPTRLGIGSTILAVNHDLNG